ncbi:MAG: hypothetical protein ACREUV_08465, partial [Burkholderiales bacterium]
MNRIVLVLAALFLGGCFARHDLVVLLPGKDGKTGAVVVSNNIRGETVLNTPYAEAEVKYSWWKANATTAAEDEVRQVFNDALATLPARPVSFVLLFYEGEVTLTAESEP